MEASSGTADADGAQQWSYCVWHAPTFSMGDLQKRLDQLGHDGWELVTASPLVKSVGLTGHEFVCIFRKPGAGLRTRLVTVSWVTPEDVRCGLPRIPTDLFQCCNGAVRPVAGRSARRCPRRCQQIA